MGARNFECFTFLKFENPSSGSKVISLQSWVLFVKKSIFFWPIPSLNFAKNYNFLAKNLDPMEKIITFEPLDRFSNFKKVNHSKFCQESIEIVRSPDPHLDP